MIGKEGTRERERRVGGSEMNKQTEIVTRGKWVGANSKEKSGSR